MKLLNCLDCHTIVTVKLDKTFCECGAAQAQYVTSRRVEYTGANVRILGVRNEEYDKATPGNDYRWFVIPEGNWIRKV